MKKLLAAISHRSERFQTSVSYIIIIVLVICGVSIVHNLINVQNEAGRSNNKVPLDLDHVREILLSNSNEETRERDANCRLWDCVNLYKCGQKGHDRLTIYVYPLQEYVDEDSGKTVSILTREYYQILEAVVRSRYYTPNPNEACLFLPSIDVLNGNLVKPSAVEKALALQNYWDNGENHIIFNMIPRTDGYVLKTDRAIILGGGFDTWAYRNGFDLSLPIYSPTQQNIADLSAKSTHLPRRNLLIVVLPNIYPKYHNQIHTLFVDNPNEVLMLDKCVTHTKEFSIKNTMHCNSSRGKSVDYPRVFEKGTFCLYCHSVNSDESDLMEILAYNCIPVIAVDNSVLPFEDVLDWSLFSLKIREAEMHALVKKLSTVSHTKIFELQRQGRWVYHRYFKDLNAITLTALEILENRIFPHKARSVMDWNKPDDNYRSTFNPLFLPIISPKAQGFTAVILTYDRVESLFTLIQKLALVPSLQSILVFGITKIKCHRIVTPRKKFKCPECTNTEMLSADLNHMRERSACIDRFASIYGRMPLRSVEFRADPVLFRDNFPEKLKRFNDVGNL
ncbi:unnamed protein product [Ceratitis capitata]|uniref:(Mediterranean fruit fly) hypothetical protein n=1 Tax=Ceratitis capitata TaxID=7213 RepID=A0A811V9N2_CERCA|nr:unnamed protein product [Ceratitis capitata]